MDTGQMSKIVEVGRYVGVDELGNWSTYQGCKMLAFGRAGLNTWADWAHVHQFRPDHLLYWDSRANLYILSVVGSDEICASGERVHIYSRPGGTIGMELV